MKECSSSISSIKSILRVNKTLIHQTNNSTTPPVMYRHQIISTTQEPNNLRKKISTVIRSSQLRTTMLHHTSNIKTGKSSRIWPQVLRLMLMSNSKQKMPRQQMLFPIKSMLKISSKFKNRWWPQSPRLLCKRLKSLARSKSSTNRRRWTSRWLKRQDFHHRDKVACHQTGSELTAPRSTLQS